MSDAVSAFMEGIKAKNRAEPEFHPELNRALPASDFRSAIRMAGEIGLDRLDSRRTPGLF